MATQKKEFKAESKRLLDLMINSIYTHNEIFIREIISNASDAIDKLYYKSLQGEVTGLTRDDFSITITANKENRTLTITDNGCGMTKEDLENNLGVIAKSGSLAFKKDNEAKEDIEIIGQFGVGFYAAFMVAKKVTVKTLAHGETKGYMWESEGAEGYEISECDKTTFGSEITLELKDDTEDDKYSDYLEQYTLTSLVKKYSDYIRYPIKMEVSRSRKKDDSDEYESYTEIDTLNSMVPLWRKNKNEISKEEYNDFYKQKFFDFIDPLKVVHMSIEGSSTFNALLYFPEKTMNYYTKEYEKGLQLYSNGVLIMEKCSDLISDHFSFVKGLVDSQDLALNISREMLQHNKQLTLIKTRLEKKIKSELSSMIKNDRENYEKLFESFGLQLKYGMYSDYGVNKDDLKDLILFYSSSEKKLVTLKEYFDRMKESQDVIYYACGDNISHIDNLPQAELVKDKGFEILYLTENVDEFAIKTLANYEGKTFKNISDNDLDVQTDEEKEKTTKEATENSEMLEFVKESLEGKVANVKISSKLKSHAVCLSSQGEITLEMEKVLNSMPQDNMMGQTIKAERVLELNSEHKIFATLKELFNSDKDKLKAYAQILYAGALLIEGMPLENPTEYTSLIMEQLA